MIRRVLVLVALASPAHAELTRDECDTLLAGARLAAQEARLLINDQLRAWVGLADDRDDTGHEARSAMASETLDRFGMSAWDGYIRALEADCSALFGPGMIAED